MIARGHARAGFVVYLWLKGPRCFVEYSSLKKPVTRDTESDERMSAGMEAVDRPLLGSNSCALCLPCGGSPLHSARARKSVGTEVDPITS